MEAQWVLAMHFLGITDDPKYPGVIQAILNEQREDGAWEVYHQSPMGDINTTVECYAALRCAGLRPGAEPVRRAREWIPAHGGLKKIRDFTKYWLALIGEWPWEYTPSVPPELIMVPNWAPFNIVGLAAGRGRRSCHWRFFACAGLCVRCRPRAAGRALSRGARSSTTRCRSRRRVSGRRCSASSRKACTVT